MAGLSVRQPQRKSLRLALLKRSNNRGIGGSLLALLSQSRAAYRNSERRSDCNSRNPHSKVSLYSSLSSASQTCNICDVFLVLKIVNCQNWIKFSSILLAVDIRRKCALILLTLALRVGYRKITVADYGWRPGGAIEG
jgi:hypothetical protein